MSGVDYGVHGALTDGPNGGQSMRLFICDPVCALPYGHNAVALAYFGKAFRETYNDITLVCCKHLPRSLVETHGFEPFYEFYYNEFIRLPGGVADELAVPAAYRSFSDEFEAVATSDADRLLDKHEMTRSDTLLFPSVDFYGVVGLLNALARRSVERRPRVLLRFIGVMETATHNYRDPVSELAARIREARDLGIEMAISAETPRLADSLSELLEIDVITTPYPDLHDPLPMPSLGPFVVYCPGAARSDKGFFQLHEIFSAVRKADPTLQIRFIAQTLNPRDGLHQQDYLSKLYAIPGLELLESTISDAEMRQNYRRCGMVLLPYDVEIYRNRGSAAMMEAACFARPLVTMAGTAFSEQVQWYRLGHVVPSVEAMVDTVLALAREPRDKLVRRALRARSRFISDVSAAYSNWLKVS